MRVIAVVAVAGVISVGSALAQQDRTVPQGQGGGMMGQGGMMGRGGMMGQREMPNLKTSAPDRSVQAVRYCKGQYWVSTAAGDVLEFPEFNLRIKTDFTDQGPPTGNPVLVPAGMMGDRAFLVFADPAEISGYIEKKCEST